MCEPFDFPRHAEREYIVAIDIAAVMVASDGRASEVRASRDLEKTYRALLVVNPDAIMLHAWWVRNRDIAEAVARIARRGHNVDIVEVIERASQERGSVAVPHATAMARMRSCGQQIDEALKAAQARGDLSWFNRAYRKYRIQRLGKPMTYHGARMRLRRAVVKGFVMTGGIAFGREMLAEVFGDRLINAEN